MTGEAQPVVKYRGDRVISGTIVAEGVFLMLLKRTADSMIR